MNNEYKFSDNVWFRVVQIIQESVLLGIDVSDLLREIRVVETEKGVLDLTESYTQKVKAMHSQLLEEAAKLQQDDEDDTGEFKLDMN